MVLFAVWLAKLFARMNLKCTWYDYIYRTVDLTKSDSPSTA